MEVCFKGSLKNLYNIFAAAGSLPKEARRCWYVAKPICDGLPTTTLSAASPINKIEFVVGLGRKSHLIRQPSASPGRCMQANDIHSAHNNLP